MIRWKFWQKEPLLEAPDPEVIDPDYVFGFDDYLGNFSEHWFEEQGKRRECLQRIHPDWTERHNLPGLPPREYKFDEPDGHRPLAPRSATYRPPKLTREEKRAVEIQQIASKHLTGLTIELKPALKKKRQEVLKGPRRVYFDTKGKMKEVEKGA